MHRVLLIESVDDAITRRRAEILADSPRLTDYVIEHCYPAGITEKDKKLPVGMLVEEVGRRPLLEDELVRKIESKIQDFHPDVILLHTGFIFRRNAQVFNRALSSLKKKYPHIGFGVQDRRALELDLSNFDQTAYVTALEELLFRRVLFM